MTHTKPGVLRLADPPDPRPALKPQQRLILGAIAVSVAEHGYSPAFREIAEAARLSSSSAAWHQVKVLMAKGYLVADEDATPAGRCGHPCARSGSARPPWHAWRAEPAGRPWSWPVMPARRAGLARASCASPPAGK